MEDDNLERRPKRQKRDSSYKAKAFERFKQLKSGTRNKYEVEEIDNVYETIDEREYTKKVLQRQEDDWIVDDDGSGYVEDGRDIFDDDLDQQSIAAAAASGNKKGVKRKKKVAENAGKGNLHSLISNMPTKKKEEGKLEEDETLAELLQEMDDAPTTPSLTQRKPKSVTNNFSPLSVKQAEKDYMNKFSSLRKPVIQRVKDSPTVQKKAQNGVHNVDVPINPFRKIQSEPKIVEPEPEPSVPESQTTIPDSLADHSESISDSQMADPLSESVCEDVTENDCFDDDLDMSQVEAPVAKNAAKTELLNNLEAEMLRDWATEEPAVAEAPINLENSDIPLTEVDGKKVFRFFWWDAFEDSLKQPGVVFLFGRTYHEKTKSFISCCVAVRNIERRIFFLPRVTEKNSDKPVSSQDVFTEINQSVMKNMQIKNFKARPIQKKYAFSPEIPAESDYIEVRYSAKDPPVSKTAEGRTFSRVFGAESSYLEILLLDRKIKGPCWLDIANPAAVLNPVSWCKLEVNCTKVADISIAKDVTGRPPLVVSSINMRRTINPKTGSNEIVMLSCVTNVSYSVDKQAPTEKFFQKHFCVFTCPDQQILPFDFHAATKNYKATTLQKMHSEKALLNYFIAQFALVDCDLVIGHDLQGYQINVLSERLVHHQIATFGKLGRVKRSLLLRQKLERELFVGRLVCDIKISAKELIKSRSYDLDSLCQAVLKLPDGARVDLEPEEVAKMFQTTGDILKLVALTMQDAAYILKIMYSLNIVPLALQITNIAGNVMSKTLMGGRSERNEFLLLHAFSEKGYIVPDKSYGKKDKAEAKGRKKPTYSGGLVLDPKVGFYDKLILLMDFNSLYPSIIQEYNICFTTMPTGLSEDNMVLPDKSLPPGILPTEIRKLVESRREVKKLMANPDLSTDQRMQYHIRQMALKLTANSMYGCLGFSNSRFFAKNLAALITHKGREILTNTKDIVQRMNYEVIYGDTDSLMINTNIVDFDQVSLIGSKIKQEINKLYKQVELDVDGVFKYLLLLKKKKYAAVILTRGKNGELRTEVEYKGLDVVRRDWSRLASEAGKFILGEILGEQSSDDRVAGILAHLRKLREDLEGGKVPLSLLVITKQLTKNPSLYNDVNTQPHVQVALRYNKESGGHLRAGDTVPYVICDDGSGKAATQRAYHVEELKNSTELKVDVNYYLAQQIHPVVSRICEPIEELDAFQIADCLGIDSSNFKKTKQSDEFGGENITKPEIKFRNVDKFVFKCYSCKTENCVEGPLHNNVPVLEKCANPQCKVRPADYVGYVQNQLITAINSYIDKYYLYEMYCEDPMCTNETTAMPLNFAGRFPVCTSCHSSVLLKKYTENDLYSQITYLYHIFDLSKLARKPLLDYQVDKAYQDVRGTVQKRLEHCAYSTVDLSGMFSVFSQIKVEGGVEEGDDFPEEEEDLEDLD
ncbi:DNA polymerase alpha catalytic subunit isoform X2 [Zophobas morio]|uniref:DNA polymerase alpha catalytic subunit isoform X1 n=1 Tax=Zophobas morio TaxID=2755281 RepID=UPI003082FCFE